MQGDVPITTGGGTFIPADPKRVSLVINSPQVNRVTLSFSPQPVLDVGINMDPGDPALVLSLLEHGDIVKRPIYAISALANQTLSYWGSSCEDVGS